MAPAHVHSDARERRSSHASLLAAIAIAACVVASCDHTSPAPVMPALTAPSLVLPTTMPGPPDPSIVAGPVVTIAGASTSTTTADQTTTADDTTTTTESSPPVIDPPTPPVVVDLAGLPVPQSPPPSCTQLFAAVSLVTGPMSSPAGEETFDATAGHPFTKCYGNVLAAVDAPFDTHSYSFEIWSFWRNARPGNLTDGSSTYTDLASYAATDDPRLDPATTTWTSVDQTNGKVASTARRATFFPCGSAECWLYLEDGASFSGPVSAHLTDSVVTIVVALAPGAVVSRPAGSGESSHGPTCDDMRTPMDAIVTAVGASASRLPNDQPDLDTGDYLACQGSLDIHVPTTPAFSIRRITYTIFVVDPARPAVLDLIRTATAPAPELGEGVTSDGGTFTVEDTPDPRLRTSTATRTIRYACGAFICWMSAYEFTYAPADPSIGFLDAQLKSYVELSRASITAIGIAP